MAGETIYSVQVDYGLRDKSAGAAAAIDRRMASTAKSAGILQSQMARMGAAAGAFFGIRQAAGALIGFNDSMEQAKIQMAGMMSQASGRQFNDTMKDSNALVLQLQQRAKVSIGTTKDMVDMAAQLTRPITAAGLGMKDLEDFTVNAVVASKAFGVESGMAARDIEAGLMGQLRSVDRFSRALLEAKMFEGKYVGEEGRAAFNALSAKDRAKEYRRALLAPGIGQMAEAQGKSFAGVFSTFKDELQIGLGKVGLPLFKAITAELSTWNKWITKNGRTIAQWSKEFGATLVKGFQMAKSAAAFLIEHKDLLMVLAKAWLAGKVVRSLVQGTAAMGQTFLNLRDAATKGLGGLASSALGAANALGMIAFAAQAIASWVDRRQTKQIEEESDQYARGEVMKRARGGGMKDATFYKMMQQDGLLNKDGTFNVGKSGLRNWKASKQFGGGTDVLMGKWDEDAMVQDSWKLAEINAKLKAGQMEIQKLAAENNLKVVEALWANRGAIGDKLLGLMGAKGDSTATPPKINVTIQRIEVQSDDPDRFVFNLGETVAKAARNGGKAYRGGHSRG